MIENLFKTELFMAMLFNIALISFFATLLCRMNWFRNVFWRARVGRREQVMLTLCFSAMSILATCMGTEINGAILNCRMIAVFSSGLLGGVNVGICTGIAAALHRYYYDIHGVTSLACAISTLVEALAGVYFHKRYTEGRLSNTTLVIISALVEVMQMLMILCFARPFSRAMEIVNVFALPMIVMNTVGEIIFLKTFQQILDEGSNEAAIRATSKEQEKTRLEQEKRLLARAEFLNLQSQVNPHFLYNCLNTISYYYREKPALGKEMLLKLAEYYRYSADEMEDFVSLDSELKHVQIYLELEKARFEDKLQYNIHTDEKIKDDFRIPSLILQPIVENAVKHGRDEDGKCLVDIKITKHGKHIDISVADNGEGMPDYVIKALENEDMPTGKVGLQNVHKRLALLTGKGLDIKVKDTGTTVCMRI